MPSHLTRHVFRRILANLPILHRECLRRQAYSSLRHGPARTAVVPHGTHIASRRTFFNLGMFGGRKKREGQEADMDPGIEEMMQLAKLERMRARMPPVGEVVRALQRLFEHKLNKKSVLEDMEAQLALQSLRYCSRCWAEAVARAEREGKGGEDGERAGQESRDRDKHDQHTPHNQHNPRRDPVERMLATASHVLSRPLQLDAVAHPELAQAVYDGLVAGKCGFNKILTACAAHVQNLASSGQATRARDVLVEYEARHACDVDTTSWLAVLRAMTQQDDEAELLATVELLRTRKLQLTHHIDPIVLSFYLRGDHRYATIVKQRYHDFWRSLPRPIPLDKAPFVAQQMRRVLQWCRERREWAYGHRVVRDAVATNPHKVIWDTIFVWAAGTGKGADEIDRMFSVMEASNSSLADGEAPRIPDIVTINLLVEFAISQNDPYLAERFIAIGHARGIAPDARTYVLQMQYRLKVHDVDGALTAYANSQSQDLSDNADIPTVNALIVAICDSARYDFDTIMNIAADLSDRNARFEAPTVSALALLHLSRDEIHDTLDLLNTHAFHFSSAERNSIIDAIRKYGLDRGTRTSRTWDAYTILRKIFDEIPRQPRTQFMLSFFVRKRPDMAVHVFNHMRQHSRADTLPTVETYIAAFRASARLQDLESLEVIHNQLKLDFTIDPTTKLYNALIYSYTECGQPRRALRFWDDIAHSREGPDYDSIHVTFRACEMAPFGDLQARELWGKLKRKGVETDQEMWGSYVGGLAGNGDVEYVFQVVEDGEKAGEVVVDEQILGKLFNAVPGEGKQLVVEKWGRQKWPEIWERLEAKGYVDRLDGGRNFQLEVKKGLWSVKRARA